MSRAEVIGIIAMIDATVKIYKDLATKRLPRCCFMATAYQRNHPEYLREQYQPQP